MLFFVVCDLRCELFYSNFSSFEFFFFLFLQSQELKNKLKMVTVGHFFRAHGEFCASHPWEVIVALITFTACMFSVDRGTASSSDPLMSASKPAMHLRQCHGWRDSCDGFEAQYIAADVILMTIVRCSAVLYCYYQFCNLHKLGSKYILGKLKFYFILLQYSLKFLCASIKHLLIVNWIMLNWIVFVCFFFKSVCWSWKQQFFLLTTKQLKMLDHI